MLPKPDTCRGCPFYGTGRGFVPDELRPVPVLVLGQAPGSHEEAGERLVARAGKVKRWEPAAPAPFLGDAGYDLGRTYLPLAGLTRDDVSLCSVVRCGVGHGGPLPPITHTAVRRAIQHCQRAHFAPPAETRVVIALGEWPLWAATGEDGGDPPPYGISRKVGGWRGWTLPYSPFMRQALPNIWTPNSSTSGVGCVYVSLHPASIYESPWMKPAAMRDWQKLGELLAGRWPRPLPPVERTMARWPDEFAYDTEFYEHAGRQVLTRWSASDGERVWVVEASEPHPPHLNRNYHVVLHQADADVDTLEGTLGPRYSLDDTMYAHAALHAELAHDLDFLGSLYARTNRWKHLVRTNPVVYSAGDALGTWDVWRALRAELARDHDTRRVYETCLLPLLPIVARARRMGIRVEQKRAEASVRALREAQRVLQLGAMAAAGWPLSLSSAKQVTTHLYDVEGL